MIKLEVHPQVLMSLSQAFPTPNMAAIKALNKYVQVLEKLLFAAWLHGPTPEQRKLKLFGLSLYQLMTKGGQIGPNKIRIHKWLKDQKLELVQAVTKGTNLTGRLSEVKLTELVTMTNTLELEEDITMNIHKKTDREISAYLTGDEQANQALFDLLYPDYDDRWSEEFILNQFDPIQVDTRSLESYIVWLTTEATKLTKDKKAAAIRQARIVLGSSKAFNGWYLQRKKPSDFGRMYYEGVSVQNVNKELRRAMLGNCWEYDVRSSVIAWKMGFAQQYLKSSGLDGDVRHTFPATLNYLEDKADFMRTVRMYVFDDHSKESGEFHIKLLKLAFTAMSFGARLASTGWQDGSGNWNNPALVNILKNTQERNRFFNDRSVRAFIKEQNTLDDYLFRQFKTHHPELIKLPCLLTHGGRLSKAKVLAYLYQHGETQVMDIVCASAAANERKPIANVHDAIFFKRRLGAELKSEIEWQMRSQTGNPYWHLTVKELKRYEPRHFDVIAEETAHKRRMAAEHAAALHYVPTGIAQFEVSVA